MTAPDDIRPESPMPPPHIGGLSPSEARETILALRGAAVRLYGREGHAPSDVQRMVAEIEKLRDALGAKNAQNPGVAICTGPACECGLTGPCKWSQCKSPHSRAALEGKP